LRLPPSRLQLRLIRVGMARYLLHQESSAPLAIGSQNQPRRQLLRGGEILLQRVRQRATMQWHNTLVAHIALISFDRDGNATRSADEVPKEVRICRVRAVGGRRMGGNSRIHLVLVKPRDGTQAKVVRALRDQ